MISFVFGMLVASVIWSFCYCLFKKPDRVYYVKRTFLCRDQYLSTREKDWWEDKYKERWCEFRGKSAAEEAIKKYKLTDVELVKGPKVKSPACRLKKRVYNWLKGDC